MKKISWDKYYFDLCNTIATNSKCLSRQIGSVLVRDKSVISTGYNGPPRGISHCTRRYLRDKNLYAELKKRGITHDVDFTKCPRQTLGYKSGEGLEWCIAAHSEAGTVINAARGGIKVEGAKLYMSCGIPCKDCMIVIINAGIEELIVTKLDYYNFMAKFLVKESKIKIRVFDLGDG